MGLTCGALVGAFMVIGLKFSSEDSTDTDRRLANYKIINKAAEIFRSKHSTIVCKELLGCDPGTEEGIKYAYDNNLFVEKCPHFVETAAEILEEIL